MNGIYWLGVDQGPTPDAAAFETLFIALRDQMVESWKNAEGAYLGLKKVREQLGLPFIDDSASETGSAAAHGAWTTELDTQAQDLHAMSTLIVKALDDAIAGKRQVSFNDKEDLVISALDSDVVVLQQDSQGVPILVQGPAAANPGEPAGHASAPIGVGVPAIVWAATATTTVLALPAYFIADAAVNGLRDVAEQKTVKTIAEKSYECVQSGKCTPEQAATINSSVYAGAAAIRLAKAKEEEASGKPSSDWAQTVKVLGFVALGVGVVYLIAKIIPKGGVGSASHLGGRDLPALPAPARDNPQRHYANR